MQKISRHTLLVIGDSYDHCLDQVVRFFNQTTLVTYDHIEPIRQRCICGSDKDFTTSLQQALQENNRIVAKLIQDLEACGSRHIDDLFHITQGYQSKTLHILSHFLDGFVGIDSYFYNLLEDSHRVSAHLTDDIQQNPAKYWLIHIDCFSTTPEEANLLHLGKRPDMQK